MTKPNDPNNRRRRFFANRMHCEVFYLVFCAASVPLVMTALGLFFMFFSVTADQLGFPEAIAMGVLPAAERALKLLCITVPLAIVAVMVIAYRSTHRLLGPYDRIVRELDQCIEGTKTTPIKLRDKDRFWPLVERINIILERMRSK